MLQLKTEWEGDKGGVALQRLAELCLTHVSDGTVPIIDFLCGCNDGACYRPDMYLLCSRIDSQSFRDVLNVMILIRRTGREPYSFFVNGNAIFKELCNSVGQCRRV